MINPITIAEWIKENSAINFKLAGVSDDGEIFIESNDAEYFYSDKGAKQEAALSEALRQKFSNIKKVTFVVKPSIKQLEEVLQGLNKLVELETSKAPKRNLLDIEEF